MPAPRPLGTQLMPFLLATSALVALAAALPSAAWAQTTTWTGAGSSNWFDATSWNSGVPGPWTAGGLYPYNAIINNGAVSPAVIGSAGAEAGTLIVGGTATGRLDLTAGGTLVVNGYAGSGVFSLLIGDQASGNGTITVSGAGAGLSAAGIAVGRAGTGRLDVLNGALVSSSLGYVGTDAGSHGTAVVDAATWNIGQLFVGSYGTGDLTLRNGGKVTVTSTLGATAGMYANSTGTITVDGAGSVLDDQGWLASMTLGYNGTGHLVVSNGGTVTSLGTCIGCGTGGVGTALVTGAGSKWQLTDSAYEYSVGGSGTGTLTVADNGLFQADSSNLIITFGSVGTGRGTLHLTTGGRAQFDVLNLGGWAAGSAGSVGQAIVESGGQLSSKSGNVGGAAGTLGQVTVTGAASRWDHTGQLTLGYEGRGEMTVSAGAQVASASGTIASNPGSSGTATVTGAGSKWSNTLFLSVGNRGIASLFVQNGGEVATGSLSVGPGGQGTVEISGGGRLTSSTVMLGTNATAGNAMSPTTGDVLVTGAGSSLVASTYIWAGSQGARGSLTIADGGTVSINNGIFNPATYAGLLYLGDDSVAGSVGTLTIGGATVAAAPGTLTAAGVAFNTPSDTLNFNHTSTNYAFAPSLLGNGTVNVRAGTTHLTGDSSQLGGFIGQVNVLGGRLYVDNRLGGGTDGAGPVLVSSGALLGGTGTIAGAVTVADGGMLEGRAGQVLKLGSLVLNANSNVNVALGAPSNAALFDIAGSLTLDGKLNVTDAGGLSTGTYRLANYAGAFTNNGLVVTSVPAGFNPGDWSIDAATAGRVNLIIPAIGANAQYWDGANMTPGNVADGRSGTGTWNSSNTNWTNQAGSINAPWASQTAVFAPRSGSAATITVEGAQAITGLTFLPPATNPGFYYTAYRFNAGAGGKLTIANAATPFDVGWTAGAARADNVIAAPIEGAGGIRKRGDGILTLRGANSYSGGTTVDAGILVADYEATALGSGPVTIGANGTLLFGAGPSGHLAITNAGELFFDTTHSASTGYAGDATITNQATGRLVISALTNARDLTIINNGGLVEGGLYVTSGNRFVEATGRRGFIPPVGSISGSGTLRGSFDVGYLNGNDVFSGVMEDIPYGTEADGITPSTRSRLVKSGTGTLTLTGANTYTGGTDVRGGRLLVNGSILGDVRAEANGTLGGKGSIAGQVVVDNNGALEGRAGQTLTMGSLDLSQNSKVNVSLGTPGGAGLFMVNGNLKLDGTLNVTDIGGFGAGVYRIFDYGGTLTNNVLDIGSMPAGTSGTIQTAVANQVNLLVDGGSGPVPATQFWNGTTTVADGTIHGGSGTWVAGPTNWTDLNGSVAAAWSGKFAVFQNNPGAVTVDNSAGAITTTGMQFIGAGWTVAGAAVTLNGAGGETSIRVGDGTPAGAAHSATIAAELSGNSRLVKNDLGTLILAGANSYAGGTTIAAGTLRIGNGGTTGSIAGDVLNNATLAFNRSDATTFGGTISGSGAVRLMSGDLTLTANNSYAGGTDIVAGSTLRLGNGGATGAIDGNIANDGTLVFNRSNGLTFAGSLGGSGTIRQVGSGRTELTGNSGGFGGVTTVENGILAVNGTLGGALDIQAAGRLEGIGTVGGTVVSGTIAPGNGGMGTLNVTGNITFNPASVYEVQVNAAGQSDRIVATGMATIDGGTVRVLAGAGIYAPATIYTILTANGGFDVNRNRFGGVTSNLAFLDPSLSYDATNVYLTMTRNGTAFQNVGITPNQIAAGSGVESLGLGAPIYNAVLNLSANQARYAFDRLSGEIHTSARTALIEDSRFIRNAVNDRVRAAFHGVGASRTVTTYGDGKPVTVAADTDRLAVWGQGFGSWGRTDGDGNAARLNRATGGFFIGADAPVFDTWRVGAVAGYSRTTFDVRERHSSGSSDNYHVGLYAGTTWGDLAFRSGAAYAWHDVSTSRTVVFPGFGDHLKATYDAGTAQVFGELGYGIRAGAFGFEPFANLAYVHLHTNRFAERGGTAALTSPGTATDATFTTLGLRVSTTFEVNGASLTAKGTLGWRHAFGDVRPLSAMRFAGGGAAFTIGGVPITRDAAVVEAGLDYAVTPNAALGVSYNAQYGFGLSDQSVRANFNIRF
ncbi:MAG: autotransporter domain-containing protein [Rhizobiales bacterium]|nr:autotransporter domain-containing protein [Hyphomicrobiales bacterium]